IGTHDPGLSPTLLQMGNVTYAPGSTLIIELGGTSRTIPTQYDSIVARGNLNLGGTLVVSLINNFMPAAGNSFDLFDWGTLNGSFSVIQLPALASGLAWNISQLYTMGVLSVTLAGDFNADGRVDAADYVSLRKQYPDITTGAGLTAYQSWRTNFGRS